MSRIGSKPIPLGTGVDVNISERTVTVKGLKGTLNHTIPELIDAKIEGGNLLLTRVNNSRRARSLHGLSRTLLANLVTGVVSGFKKELQIQGVGYRAQVKGKTLVLNLGFSHPIEFPIPEEIQISVAENTRITVEGIDKQQVGQVAASIRGFRPPEPYKGKGIRYFGEYVMQKEGKSV
jgi:large subunit ribosomal protein L6